MVALGLSGVAGQTAIAACNSDAAGVETAVAAYQAKNSGDIPSSISELLSVTHGGPYLQVAPSNEDYLIMLDGTGQVLVALATGVTTSRGEPLTPNELIDLPLQVPGFATTAAGDTFRPQSKSPGSTWVTGSAGHGSLIGTAAEVFDGPSSFSWFNDAVGSNVPASAVGQNICAGA